MESLFNASNNFVSLSLRDLIDAREVFHYHLLSKKNVVATALGPYRIRKEDPWPDRLHPKEHPTPAHRGKRTLFNSEVRPYSWPSIYVFVSQISHCCRRSRMTRSTTIPVLSRRERPAQAGRPSIRAVSGRP